MTLLTKKKRQACNGSQGHWKRGVEVPGLGEVGLKGCRGQIWSHQYLRAPSGALSASLQVVNPLEGLGKDNPHASPANKQLSAQSGDGEARHTDGQEQWTPNILCFQLSSLCHHILNQTLPSSQPSSPQDTFPTQTNTFCIVLIPSQALASLPHRRTSKPYPLTAIANKVRSVSTQKSP